MGYIIAAVILALLIASFRLWRTAVRLDRLHLRTQAAWAALDGALARRAVAARAIAAAGKLDPELAIELRTAARGVDGVDPEQRADAENDLTRVLETLPVGIEPDLAEELSDAAERVILARRFYNDAVRDTRALRDVLFTRIFRLAGTAALPNFFEIAEYEPVQPLPRVSARVVLLDGADRVLLFHGTDPQRAATRWWFTPGGGVEPGEELVQAAQRELMEETSIAVAQADFQGPIWWRRARFAFNGVDWESTEHYFLVRVTEHSAGNRADVAISTDGFTDLERETVLDHRWWTVEELQETSETIYPVELAARLVELVGSGNRRRTTAAEQIRIR